VERASIEAGEPPGERVAIRTFLIADVRGYTRFTVERGDEALNVFTRMSEQPYIARTERALAELG